MKKTFCLVLVVFTNFFSYCQAPDYDDLKILYADGKYEKLVSAADKYTLKESTSKDPNAFMWLARGLYKISISGNSDEKYATAYKDAIGALSKVTKLDKDTSCRTANKEFVDEFQMSLANRVNDFLTSEKFRDASGMAVKYYKISTNIIGAKYIEASAKYRSADKGGASALWKECDKILTTIVDLETWSEADISLFKSGILMTADCYINGRQKEKAVDLLNKVAPWFEADEEFKARYDELTK